MSNPHYKAYLLHQRPYRETSVIVDLLSETEGRVRAVCKGVRGSGRRAGSLRSALQPFAELSLQLGGKSELRSLRQVELLGTVSDLSRQRLYAALYINELLVRLLHVGEVHSGLYADYCLAIERLAEKTEVDGLGDNAADVVADRAAEMKIHDEVTLRLFEFRLLAALGFAIDFSLESSNGRPIEPAQQYSFDAGSGFTLAPISISESSMSREFFSGECLQALQREDLSIPLVRKVAKKITRVALAVHLGNRSLNSRDFYRRPC